jgi:hypothetical protein
MKVRLPMMPGRTASRCGKSLAMLLLSLVIFLSACGGSSTPTPAPTPTSAPVPTATTAAAPPTNTPVPTAVPTRPGPSTAGTPGALGTPGTPLVAALQPTSTPLPPTATPVPPTATPLPPTPTPVPRAGQPVRLKIPKIKVDAAIEYVGLAADGAMDVPKNYNNTAWYEPGPRPGDQGNAVIDGHVDSKTNKAVFWDLPKLQPGDEIFVVGDDGVERRFVVVDVESYKRADAPLDRIFGPTTDRHLNLITCDSTSTFDRTKGEYAANVVVYAELAP